MLSILGGPALRFPLWFQSLKPSPFAVLPVSTSLNSTPFVVPHRSTVGGMPPRSITQVGSITSVHPAHLSLSIYWERTIVFPFDLLRSNDQIGRASCRE